MSHALIALGALAGCATVVPSLAPAPDVRVGEIDHPDPRARDYLRDVQAGIRQHWTYPCGSGPGEVGCRYVDGTVLLDLGLAPNGELAHARVFTSSGVPALDAAAVKAVRAAAPFKPAPASLVKGTRVEIRVRMQYRHDVVPVSERR